MSGVCPTLIQCDLCEGHGHYEFDCPYARCDLCHTKGNRHSLECPLHPLNVLCTVCGMKTHLAWGRGTCETYPFGKGKGKGTQHPAGESSGAGVSGQSGGQGADPGFGQGGNPQSQPQLPPQGDEHPGGVGDAGGTDPPPPPTFASRRRSSTTSS